jgi:intein-encoded DNA endonuclease-like protein
MKTVSSSRFENWTPQPSESTSDSNFTEQSVTHSNISRSLVFKWHKRFSDSRGSLMDDKREERQSFKTSDVVKNEVRNVIDGNRRLTVREVADKCVISKTTVHETLVQELHMNRHSSETMFHLWLLFYPEIQFRSS